MADSAGRRRRARGPGANQLAAAPCMDRCMCNVEEDETHMTASTCPVASCISICVCKWASYGPAGPCIRMHECMRRAICRTCSADIYLTSLLHAKEIKQIKGLRGFARVAPNNIPWFSLPKGV